MISYVPLEISFSLVKGTYAGWEMENSIHKVKVIYDGREQEIFCEKE